MRILKAHSGEQLFKAIRIKVFHPGNKRSSRHIHRAPHGQGINATGVDSILARTSDEIDKTWPGQEYSLIPLSPASFNFVWREPGESVLQALQA